MAIATKGNMQMMITSSANTTIIHVSVSGAVAVMDKYIYIQTWIQPSWKEYISSSDACKSKQRKKQQLD